MFGIKQILLIVFKCQPFVIKSENYNNKSKGDCIHILLNAFFMSIKTFYTLVI